jgi:hypothetical protein
MADGQPGGWSTRDSASPPDQTGASDAADVHDGTDGPFEPDGPDGSDDHGQ